MVFLQGEANQGADGHGGTAMLGAVAGDDVVQTGVREHRAEMFDCVFIDRVCDVGDADRLVPWAHCPLVPRVVFAPLKPREMLNIILQSFHEENVSTDRGFLAERVQAI